MIYIKINSSSKKEHFSKEYVQMVNRYGKEYSISLIIRKISIKTKLVRLATNKKMKDNGENKETHESYTLCRAA